jgi:hypothetical protein
MTFSLLGLSLGWKVLFPLESIEYCTTSKRERTPGRRLQEAGNRTCLWATIVTAYYDIPSKHHAEQYKTGSKIYLEQRIP